MGFEMNMGHLTWGPDTKKQLGGLGGFKLVIKKKVCRLYSGNKAKLHCRWTKGGEQGAAGSGKDPPPGGGGKLASSQKNAYEDLL